MKVWWCEEHKCTGGEICVVAVWEDTEYDEPVSCRMVEMQLVPADARMVSGDVIERLAQLLALWTAYAVFSDMDAEVKDYWRQQAERFLSGMVTSVPKDPWDYDP